MPLPKDLPAVIMVAAKDLGLPGGVWSSGKPNHSETARVWDMQVRAKDRNLDVCSIV